MDTYCCSFVIAGDGNVYEGRGWRAQGILPEKYKEYNTKAIVMGFIGHYTGELSLFLVW